MYVIEIQKILFHMRLHAQPIWVISRSMILIPMNGADDAADTVYEQDFQRSNAAAAPKGPSIIYPRRASGTSAMMMSALKMSAERMADCGVWSRMTFSTCNTGKAPANMAGMIAKYLATSLATENVVSIRE